jgi:2-aminoadipate transaminase
MRRAAGDERVVNLAGGLPAVAQFPRAALAKGFLRVLAARGSPGLQYGWPEGQPSLRARIADRLRQRAPAARLTADDVIITNGAQQAIALAVQLLARRGDRIAVEPACYPAALELFRDRGLDLIDLSDGQARARVTYVMPALGNPTGTALDRAARARLLARPGWIIEDDAYGDLTFDEVVPPLLAERRRRIVYVGTFSKTLCPGLRVGWIVVPPALRERALRLKQSEDLQAGSLAQSVVDDYLAHHDFDARLIAHRRYYLHRARRLARAIHHALPAFRFEFPHGGFCLWVETPEPVDEVALLHAAVAEGVCYDVGSAFQTDPARQALTRMRLCYSAEAPDRFDEGARRLARAWRRVQRQNCEQTTLLVEDR